MLSSYQVYDGLFYYTLQQNDSTEHSKNNKLGIHKSIFDFHDSVLFKEILIEFNKDIPKIYRDIDTNKKDFSQITILVCWEVDFENRSKMQKNKGDILSEKDVTTNVFYGVTHQLIGIRRQQPLPIIELKTILEEQFDVKM